MEQPKELEGDLEQLEDSKNLEEPMEFDELEESGEL